MAYPTKPVISTSYTATERAQQDGTFPGVELDIDFANLAAGVEGTIDFLSGAVRSDGKLQNGVVERESLSSDLLTQISTGEVGSAGSLRTFSSVAGMLADTTLGYSATGDALVTPGQAVTADGGAYRYVVMDATTPLPGEYLQTAGGVILRVDPAGVEPTPLWWGAAGDGVVNDTPAMEGFVAWLVARSTALTDVMPGVTQGRSGVSIDANLAGRTYLLSRTLVISGCDGVAFRNGTLLAGSGLNPTDPVLFADFTWWLRFDATLHVQCNDQCNGVNLQRCWGAQVSCRVLGFAKRDFGIRIGPVGYSVSARVTDAWLGGFISADVWYSGTPEAVLPADRTAKGLDIQANDVTVIGGYYALALHPISITGSGIVVEGTHIYNGLPGDQPSAPDNSIGISIQNGGDGNVLIHGNYIDNCNVTIYGNPSRKAIRDNMWFTAGDKAQQAMVLLFPDAFGTDITSLVIADNHGTGTFVEIVGVNQADGNFDRIFRSEIADNTVTTYTLSYPLRRATKGTFAVNTDAAPRDGNNIYTLDLAPHVFPIVGDNSNLFFCNVGYQRFSGFNPADTGEILWWSIDFSNRQLKVKGSVQLAGRFCVTFDMSPQSEVVTL